MRRADLTVTDPSVSEIPGKMLLSALPSCVPAKEILCQITGQCLVGLGGNGAVTY